MVNLYWVWNTVSYSFTPQIVYVVIKWQCSKMRTALLWVKIVLKTLSTINKFIHILNIKYFCFKKQTNQGFSNGVEQNKHLNSPCRFTKTLKGRCHGSGTADSCRDRNSSFWRFRILHPLNVFAPGCSCCVQKQPYLSFNCFPFDSDARRYMNSGEPTGGNCGFLVKGQRVAFHSNI